jgi:hypothetical protein
MSNLLISLFLSTIAMFILNVLIFVITNIIKKNKIKLEIDKYINATISHDGFYYWNYYGISFKGELNLTGFYITPFYDPHKKLYNKDNKEVTKFIIKEPEGIKEFKELVKNKLSI